MAIYMVRHGETDWNKANRVLGRTDLPLNENGLAQAAQLAAQLAEVPLDVIYTSPLQRTVITAGIIAASQRQSCPVIREPRLIEHDYGVFEGVDRRDPVYQQEKRAFFKRYPSGESYMDVAGRVYPFLDSLRTEEFSDKNILLVTHGGVCRIISNYFYDMGNEEFPSFAMKNCEIRRLDPR